MNRVFEIRIYPDKYSKYPMDKIRRNCEKDIDETVELLRRKYG